MTFRLFSRKPKSNGSANGRAGCPPMPHLHEEFEPAPAVQLDSDPLKRLFQQGRYNIMLRQHERWASHSQGAAILEKAQSLLEERMALVPEGSVTLCHSLMNQPGAPEEDKEVKPFLLDVHCVTNARFQHFVDAGGYDELEYWPEEIWPHLIELKDLTGQPGPRFWRHGRHNALLSDHPVVGISWYEAQAFALWIGQRLPTEAEWQMAASWHIKSTTDVLRRFPWGDAMDIARCNIWSSRVRRTAPVDQYPNGAAPNHVLQLVGNVWEWMDNEYAISDENGRPIVGEMPMHAVRGGAFDTYFESQATSDFRTGQIALGRSYNTGFRCAMDLSDAAWLNGT
jgi:gamma-glutamyl hercynylcysteine S-oxide synthase